MLSWKRLVTVPLCFLTLWPITIWADNWKDLENNLRQSFHHRTLSLRTPYFGDRLHFDSAGNLIGKAETGPWSTCGLFEAEKISLKRDQLEIEGKRIVLGLRSTSTDGQSSSIAQEPQITTIVTEDSVRIVVEMSALDVPQAREILSHVLQGGPLAERVAAYWKPNTNDPNAFRRDTPKAVFGQLEGARPVYGVKRGFVEPPKPIFSPDPIYSDRAKRAHLQGVTILFVVINEKGVPEVLEIVKSLGDGLDIQALAAVAKWKFHPALKDGLPVASVVNVEVNFHLF